MVMDPSCLAEWVTIHRRLVHADEARRKVGYSDGSADPAARSDLEVHWGWSSAVPDERAVWEGRARPARAHAPSTCSRRGRWNPL